MEDFLLDRPSLQIVFVILYIIVFITGIGGNLMVLFVVYRKKAMQTTTNNFITNLAVSDIMMCLTAVPFTPLSFFMKTWLFGKFLCGLLPMMMCVLVYVSTFTCAIIAVLRYYAVIYPLQPKMGRCTFYSLIIFIWAIAFIISFPLGIFSQTVRVNDTVSCVEIWPKWQSHIFFTFSSIILQYLIPCSVIIYCYVKISLALDKRLKSNILKTCADFEREQRKIQRKRRTNRMMIYVAMVFVICWMPINLVFIMLTISPAFYFSSNRHSNLIFLTAHLVAMSSATYNPFIYVFMSEKFKTEFKDLFSCRLCK